MTGAPAWVEYTTGFLMLALAISHVVRTFSINRIETKVERVPFIEKKVENVDEGVRKINGNVRELTQWRADHVKYQDETMKALSERLDDHASRLLRVEHAKDRIRD